LSALERWSMSEVLLSKADILAIPEELCPMMVFSDNLRSLISWGIKMHEKGNYNHAMWYLGNGKVASQNLLFEIEPIKNYWSKCRLKFWHAPLWSREMRRKIKREIIYDTNKRWYKRLYDPLAIVGQALHLDWLQTPGFDICSDKAKYLAILDPLYDLEHPDPEDVNRWLEKNQGRYQVYGRYVPD
jgi:hypothetical protein